MPFCPLFDCISPLACLCLLSRVSVSVSCLLSLSLCLFSFIRLLPTTKPFQPCLCCPGRGSIQQLHRRHSRKIPGVCMRVRECVSVHACLCVQMNEHVFMCACFYLQANVPTTKASTKAMQHVMNMVRFVWLDIQSFEDLVDDWFGQGGGGRGRSSSCISIPFPSPPPPNSHFPFHWLQFHKL